MANPLHREYLQGSDVAFGEPGPLSPREHEALVCTAEGLTFKGVARVMGVCERTANCHIESAMHKLAAKNRVHLVWLASSYGLIVPAGFAAYAMLIVNIVIAGALFCLMHSAIGVALAASIVSYDGPIRSSRPFKPPVRLVRNIKHRTGLA